MHLERNEGRGKIRVFLVGGHKLMCRALQCLFSLERDIVLCGVADNGIEAVPAMLELNPDVVLVDLQPECGDGLELIRQLRAQSPDSKVLVMSNQREGLIPEAALRAGARGFVAAQEGVHKVVEAIRVISKGKRFVTDAVAEEMMRRLMGRLPPGMQDLEVGQKGIQELTSQELATLQICELASRLGVGFHEVANRLQAASRGVLFPSMMAELGRRLESERKPHYSIDAPYLLTIPAVLMAGSLIIGFTTGSPWPFLATAVLCGCFGFELYLSRRGKFVVWAELLDDCSLRGDERILDLGCGQGAVLLLAAQHLTTGRAVGVDLWRNDDLSDNFQQTAARNASGEGVADRVELCCADMVALPFANESFDLVVSNVAVHLVQGQAGRDKALQEAVRVLRPGGRLLIADIRGTRHYLKRIIQSGMTDVQRRSLGWRLWWGGPWLPTRLVSATKPSRRLGGERTAPGPP